MWINGVLSLVLPHHKVAAWRTWLNGKDRKCRFLSNLLSLVTHRKGFLTLVSFSGRHEFMGSLWPPDHLSPTRRLKSFHSRLESKTSVRCQLHSAWTSPRDKNFSRNMFGVGFNFFPGNVAQLKKKCPENLRQKSQFYNVSFWRRNFLLTNCNSKKKRCAKK